MEKLKYSLVKVDELPHSLRESFNKDLINFFLNSGNAISKVVGMNATASSGLRATIFKMNLDKKIAVAIRSKSVYLYKIKT